MIRRTLARTLLGCALTCLPAQMTPAAHASPATFIERITAGAQLDAAGNLQGAREVYETLYAEYPKRPDVALRLESVYARLGMHAESVRLLETWLDRRPSDVTFRMRYGAALYAQGRQDDAFGQWERLLKGARNPALFVTVAENYERRNLDDRAADVYRRGREALRVPELFIRELAEIAERKGRYLEATREYITLAETKPQYLPLVESRLKQMAQEATSHEAILGDLSERVREKPDPQIQRILVTFAEAAGLGRAAYEILVSLEPGTGIEGSLGRLGELGLQTGDPDLAADAYRRLLAGTRNAGLTAVALLGLGRAEQERDNAGAAAAHFGRIVEEFARYPVAEEATYRLAGLYAAHGETSSAITQYRVLAGRGGASPWRIRALFDLADLYIAAEQDSLAFGAYSAIRVARAGRDEGTEATLRSARLLYFGQHFELAHATLDSLLKGNLSAGAINDALELDVILESGLEEDRAGLSQLALADRLRHRGSFAAAADTLESALAARPDAPLSDRLLQARIEALTGLERYEQVADACAQLIQRWPEGPLAPWAGLRLADTLFLQLARPDNAAAAYERVLIDYPQSVEADIARERLRELRIQDRPSTGRETG